VVLGYPDNTNRFIQWLQEKQYRPQGWNVVPREYRFFDLVMPSGIEDQVIPDLMHFEARTLKDKGEPLMKWVRRFTVLDEIDRKKYTPHSTGEMGYRAIDGKNWWVYLYMLGKIHDKWSDEGHEYL
jgi:hypothetical protein